MHAHDEDQIWNELDKLAVWAAIGSVVILTVVYLLVGMQKPQPDTILWALQGFVLNIITGLVPVGILFLGSYALFRRIQMVRSEQEINKLASRISSLVNQSTKPAEDLLLSGIRKVHNELPRDLLQSKYRGATHSIYILTTWMDQVNPYVDALIQSEKAGVPVRILLMDPVGVSSKQRLLDLGYQQDSTRPQVALEALGRAISTNKLRATNVTIKVYNASPPCYLCSIDGWFLVGFFWAGKDSVEGPHFEIIDQSSMLGKAFHETFECLWDKSHEITR